MLRKIGLFTLATLVSLTLAAAAQEASKEAAKKAPTPTTLTGELVDTGCYLAHGARGEKHIGCATKCISGGMPMGILTSAGKLYLVTLDHDNPDPYNKLKDMAGEMVEVTGTVDERNGVKAIDVTEAKLAAAEPAK